MEKQKESEVILTKVGRNVIPVESSKVEAFACFDRAIRTAYKSAEKAYLSIALALYEIDRQKLYQVKEYDCITVFAEATYGIKSSQTYNYLNIVKRFGDVQSDGSCAALKKEYGKYSVSQLVRMLRISDENLKEINSSMTVKAIELMGRAFQEDSKPPKRLPEKDDYSKILLEIKSEEDLEKAMERIKKSFNETDPQKGNYIYKVLQVPCKEQP